MASLEAPDILVALDYRHADVALSLVDRLDPSLCGLKVGKELFTAAGPALVKELVRRDFAVFLDLKFHDIPNTVSGAVAAAADLGVWMLNVHASGGTNMMEAARKSLESFGAQRPLITAVTVLTSFSDENLRAMGIDRSLQEQVSALALMAEHSGMDGVVCSAHEAVALKNQRREGFLLVTPGIRLESNPRDDQQRIVTPRQAVQRGADYLVIGRPVTQSPDPMQTLRLIKKDISYK